jgi:hypothetical protein
VAGVGGDPFDGRVVEAATAAGDDADLLARVGEKLGDTGSDRTGTDDDVE